MELAGKMIEPPQQIRAHRSTSEFEIVWSDRTDRLPFRFVRGRCPCAVCVNEMTGERKFGVEAAGVDVAPTGVEPTGNYALKILWNDGHHTGLFSWTYWRNIADELRQASASQ